MGEKDFSFPGPSLPELNSSTGGQGQEHDASNPTVSGENRRVFLIEGRGAEVEKGAL